MTAEQVKYMGIDKEARTGPVRSTAQMAADAFFESYPDAERCRISEGTEPVPGLFLTKIPAVKEFRRG